MIIKKSRSLKYKKYVKWVFKMIFPQLFPYSVNQIKSTSDKLLCKKFPLESIPKSLPDNLEPNWVFRMGMKTFEDHKYAGVNFVRSYSEIEKSKSIIFPLKFRATLEDPLAVRKIPIETLTRWWG